MLSIFLSHPLRKIAKLVFDLLQFFIADILHVDHVIPSCADGA